MFTEDELTHLEFCLDAQIEKAKAEVFACRQLQEKLKQTVKYLKELEKLRRKMRDL
jgi:hypothetical protein